MEGNENNVSADVHEVNIFLEAKVSRLEDLKSDKGLNQNEEYFLAYLRKCLGDIKNLELFWDPKYLENEVGDVSM